MAYEQWIDSNEQWVDRNCYQWGVCPPVVTTASGNLGATIAGHLPVDLPGQIHSWQEEDLLAQINILRSRHLPASIGGHLPKDLSAYLKPWPQKDLGGSMHGWQAKNLSAVIDTLHPEDLPGIIGAHRPRNISALLKGWVREATSDLPATIGIVYADDLPGVIYGTDLGDLPADIFAIRPRDLPAFIHGWQEADLPATIIGDAWPWDLPASINLVGYFDDLPATITSRTDTRVYSDLSAYILTTQGVEDLPASLNIKMASDLGAYIDPGKDIGDLSATIYPKMIRLTGILSLVTMEHSDLSATISVPCFYSEFKDLSAYARAVYQANLGATINPQNYAWGVKNLGASFGYAENTVVQDKLSINVSIAPLGFRTEDKFTVTLSLFRGGLGLGASITGTYVEADLSAEINGVYLSPYHFENWKNQELVIDRSYSQVLRDYEDIDIEFETIVSDYFYSSGSNAVAKIDKYQHFLTRVSSYYSSATSTRLGRQLHKVKRLYDMRSFENIDEAIKYAIWYVTTQPDQNLSAYINGVETYTISNLTARLGVTRYTSTDNNLTSYINGTTLPPYDVVISYTDDGVGYLQF